MKTLKALIAQLGIDEAHEVALLNRRARYAMTRDRTKVYASTLLGSITVFGRKPDGSYINVHDVHADLKILKLAGMDTAKMPNRTRDYVAAWCRLNNLKA